MLRPTLLIAVVILASHVLSADGCFWIQPLDKAWATDDLATPPSDLARLSPEAARMYACVKKTRPGELRWQQIPWLTDLREGMRRAAAEQRPLLLFVSGDEPLERC
jgi:hypothetical protein